jgi:hypothetical protein
MENNVNAYLCGSLNVDQQQGFPSFSLWDVLLTWARLFSDIVFAICCIDFHTRATFLCGSFSVLKRFFVSFDGRSVALNGWIG